MALLLYILVTHFQYYYYYKNNYTTARETYSNSVPTNKELHHRQKLRITETEMGVLRKVHDTEG
jgi:hypothetical protein